MKKEKKNTIRAYLQMEGKIYARNNFSSAACSIDFGKGCLAERRAFIALLGISRKMDTQPLW